MTSPSTPSGKADRALLLGFFLIAAASFLAYCSLDSGPRPWDEAFFLFQPTCVATALESQGFISALQAFWETPYHKPPLAMFGNLPGMLIFGSSGIGFRIDNLLLLLCIAWAMHRWLRRYVSPKIATLGAIILVASPYVQQITRMELAELYLWSMAAMTIFAMEPLDCFRAWRPALIFGLITGLGMLAKLSFPMVISGPVLWLLARTLLAGIRGGDLWHRCINLCLSAVVCLLTFVPFYAKNWSAIYGHFSAQFGRHALEYGQGNPWTLAYFKLYFSPWLEWFGSMGILVFATAAVLLMLVFLKRRNQQSTATRSSLWAEPVGPLTVGFLVNLVYCYFHPVVDLRFTLGSFLFLLMLLFVVLGRSAQVLGIENRTWSRWALVLPLLILLSNSFYPGSGKPVLNIPSALFGSNRQVLPLDVGVVDLRGPLFLALPKIGDAPQCIAFAGDHSRLNSDNVRLEMKRRGLAGDAWQLGYLPDSYTPMQRIVHGKDAQTWVVIDCPIGAVGTAWSHRYMSGMLEVLLANPDYFAEQEFPHSLGGHPVRIFHRMRKVDDGLLQPGERKAKYVWTSNEAQSEEQEFQSNWPGESQLWSGPDGGDINIAHSDSQSSGLSIHGDGSAVWQATRHLGPLMPSKRYRLNYCFAPEGETELGDSGCLFIGTDSIHWDVFPGQLQEQVTFLTSSQGDQSLYAGQYKLHGQARLNSWSITQVHPVHRDFGLCVLGEGEWIRKQSYAFKTDFQDGPAASRCLHSFSGKFHTDHFILAEPEDYLRFEHDLGKIKGEGGVIRIRGGSASQLDVSALMDGRPVQLSSMGEEGSSLGAPFALSFSLGKSLITLLQVEIRLRPQVKSPVRVSNYSFRCATDSAADFTATGRSKFLP